MNTVPPENARVLLGIAEQRRQHLTTAINVLNGLAATLGVAIWTFFLKAYFDSSSAKDPSTLQPTQFPFAYVIVASGMSALVVSLWRLYAKFLDDAVAQIYPEIMKYEQFLGVGGECRCGKGNNGQSPNQKGDGRSTTISATGTSKEAGGKTSCRYAGSRRNRQGRVVFVRCLVCGYGC